MKTILKFIGDIFHGIWKTIKGIVKGLVQNTEGVVILVAASIGFTTIISNLPFAMSLPMWIEASMVAPVLGVLMVSFCLFIMTLRPEEA
jgi:hypothetical protein